MLAAPWLPAAPSPCLASTAPTRLIAGSGTTELYGGPDANTLIGGAGNDSFYVYSDQTQRSPMPTPAGNNTLVAIGVNAILPENVGTLNSTGSGLTGTGNDQSDSIFGDGVGSSTLIAGSGDAYMVGWQRRRQAGCRHRHRHDVWRDGANTFVFAPGDAPVGQPLTSTTSAISSPAPISSISRRS